MASVNHRFMSVKVRGTPVGAALEDEVSRLVRSWIGRGAVTVSLGVEGVGSVLAGEVRPNLQAARRIHRELRELALALRIDEPVSLDLVCGQPGVMAPHEADENREAFAASVIEAAREACNAMVEMRSQEGKMLAQDLSGRLGRIREIAGQIEQVASDSPQDACRRVRERLDRLLQDSGVTVDEARLAQTSF